jgi:uncharacterized protein involved in exopolysaccharide biosynthesis/Mrp family chromosome partitioning ATPase
MSLPPSEPPDHPDPASRAVRDVSIRPIVAVLWLQKWLIIALAVLGGLLSGLVGLFVPRSYEATVQLIVDLPVGAAASNVGSDSDELTRVIEDYLTMLRSPALLRRAMTAIDDSDEPQAAESTASWQPDVLEPIGSLWRQLSARLRQEAPPLSQTPRSADLAGLDKLRKALSVDRESRSRVIRVSVKDGDPERGAMVANTFAQVFLDDLVARNRSMDERELANLVLSLPVAERELVDAVQQLESERLTSGVGDSAAFEATVRELGQNERDRVRIAAALAATTAQLSAIVEPRISGAGDQTTWEAPGEPDSGIDAQIQSLRTEAQNYRSQLEVLSERSAALNSSAARTADHLARLRARQEQVDVASRRYNEMLSWQAYLNQRLGSPSPGLSVLSPAWPPSNLDGLSPIFLMPPGMILGGLMGAIFVLFREDRRQTLRSEQEAVAALGIPCAGLLPRLPTPQARWLLEQLHAEPEGTYSRAARMLMVTLASGRGGAQRIQVIFVTSAVPGEHKAELAWTLALAASRLQRPVAFLDLDERLDQLTAAFRNEYCGRRPAFLPNERDGRRAEPWGIVAPMTDIGIDYIPAREPDRILQRFGSVGEAADPLEPLRNAYGTVIVNGPTCLEHPELGIVAASADFVLLAVGWNATEKEIVRRATNLVRMASGGKGPTMSVLTGVNLKQYARASISSGSLLTYARTHRQLSK